MFPIPNNPADLSWEQWSLVGPIVFACLAGFAWFVFDIRRMGRENARRQRQLDNAVLGRYWAVYGRSEYLLALRLAARHGNIVAHLTLVGEILRDGFAALGFDAEAIQLPSFPTTPGPLIKPPARVYPFPAAKGQ